MKINPRNFFKRRIDILPPHFTVTKRFLSDYEATKVDRWIHENCNGRYCLVKTVTWTKDAWKPETAIGFEEPSDLTLLALSGKLNTERSNLFPY
jgi:hypothetical protein